ncbi:MAG TPA: hypothetical protein DEH78_20010 [Solibacterales bacterium]|nr:hypothetical protein [Bryobacterales bacterium]
MNEQRKSRRYELKLPVELVKAGSRRVSGLGETQNVSSGGVLFTSEAPVEIGAPIEYFISLPSGMGRVGDVRLRCLGKVLRREEERSTIAATLERYEFVRNLTH